MKHPKHGAPGMGHPAGNDMQKTTSFMARIMPPQGLGLIERAREAIHPHRIGLLSIGVITTL